MVMRSTACTRSSVVPCVPWHPSLRGKKANLQHSYESSLLSVLATRRVSRLRLDQFAFQVYKKSSQAEATISGTKGFAIGLIALIISQSSVRHHKETRSDDL